jgi:hypothetical protein
VHPWAPVVAPRGWQCGACLFAGRVLAPPVLEEAIVESSAIPATFFSGGVQCL